MYEKALIALIFMYSVSFGVLVAQYIAGDLMGITLVNYRGEEIQSDLLDIVNTGSLNAGISNVTGTNQTEIITDPITAAAKATYQIFLLITGTYIFNVLYQLGVPPIAIAGMVLLYALLMIRAFIAYLRGI